MKKIHRSIQTNANAEILTAAAATDAAADTGGKGGPSAVGGDVVLPPGLVEGPSGGLGGVAGPVSYNLRSGPVAGPAFVPTDTLYDDQWHFDQLGVGSREYVERIWDEYSGNGVHVGVYDSGVQSIHQDLNDNYDPTLHVIVGGNVLPGDPIANPPAGDAHGTAVAGIIGAELNGDGVVGIAWGSSLTGVNIFDPSSPAFINAGNITGFLEAVHQMASFDVTNNSWGSTPFYASSQSLANPAGFDARVNAEYEFAVENGRGGLGTNIVQSAGNDNRDANGTGLNASHYTITVAALLETGFISSYSNFGANILVSASGGDTGNPPVNGTRRITTTDLLGTDGFNTLADPSGSHDYTDRMNGTSAAAPMVSGVIALMLEANADLGWRDVQDILSATAFRTGSALGGPSGLNENHTWFINGANNWNGGGMHYSNDYGYGSVDLYGAVRMAEAYKVMGRTAQTSANEISTTTGTLTANLPIPDNQPGSPVNFNFNVADNISIEHIALNINFTTTFIGDIRIVMTSAEGTQVVVQTQNINIGTDLTGQSWVYGIDALHGELSAGTWTLSFTDNFGTDLTTVNSVNFTAYGTAVNVNDTYTYTDELTAMNTFQPGRTTLTDTNGGIDWVNFAAFTGNATVNLNAGIAGTITIAAGTTIENVITGDGNDTITGNASGNKLYGMRGNDTISGENGNDTIEGGVGTDTLNGGNDNDTFLIGASAHYTAGEVIDGGAGTTDRIRFTSTIANDTLALNSSLAGVEIVEITNATGSAGGTTTLNLNASALTYGVTLKGNTGVNNLVGSSFVDVIEGNGGNDTIEGKSGSDTLRGGDGNDVFQIAFAVHHGSTEIIDGGAGATDRIRFTSTTANDILHLTSGVTNVEIIEMTNAAGSAGGLTTLTIDALALTYGVTINGNAGVNTIYGTAFIDTINGNAGNDTIEGSLGSDILRGGDGNDVFLIKSSSEHTAAELIDGSVGTQDRIRFTSTNTGQTLNLSNQVTGVEFVDISSATGSLGGTTQLNVSAAALTAGITINGNAGHNTLTGSAFADTINGNLGNDTLIGGGGNDTLDGGAGNDIFRFASALGASNIDTILNYVVADDRMELNNSVFTSLVDGWLTNAAFTANTTGLATTTSQRIIYETDTGALFYDSNGSSAGGIYQQFAQLAAGLGMTASEFFVI